MAELAVLTHPACREHDLPEGTSRRHPERPARLDAARKGIGALDADVRIEQPAPLDRDALASVHDPAHVREVEEACSTGRFLDADTYVRPESWRAARLSAGAAVEAARLAVDGTPAFAVTRPPGHHATADTAMGFCLFNNAALAAHALAQEGHEVAIVDLDVHHGNGTQEIFYDRDDVLYASIHQSPFYPGTGLAHETGQGPGEGTTVNLPVPSGTGHAGWLELVDRVLEPTLEAFQPDAILLSAGFDAHREDPVGGLELVAGTFHRATRTLSKLAPTAAILEGGYSLEALERCTHATAAALVDLDDPVRETIVEGVRPWGMLESGVQSYLAPHWPVQIS